MRGCISELYQAPIYPCGFVAVDMNLALGLKRLPSLSLAGTLAIIMAVVLLAAGVASAAVRFFHGLNVLLDTAAAHAYLFDFLLKKIVANFFPLFFD